MKILLDLQAAQGGSRFRGIGRYSLYFARALAIRLVAKGHQVSLLLSGNFPDSIPTILEWFGREVDVDYFVFSVMYGGAPAGAESFVKHRVNEWLRELAVARVAPDLVHLSTLQADGWADDVVNSIGMLDGSQRVAVTHYDLIPLAHESIYLVDDMYRQYYLDKLESEKRADLLFAISEFSRLEAIEMLNIDPANIVNISAAVDQDGTYSQVGKDLAADIRSKYGIVGEFVLYAPGGFDHRKNLNRLLEAYSSLSEEIRAGLQLIIASGIDEEARKAWEWKAGSLGLPEGSIRFVGYVPDEVLVELYRACKLYVFPSLHEGFGLPVLEAMMCGAPVIASNTTSLPEVVGLEEALFDPESVDAIAYKMGQVLVSEEFSQKLREHALRHAKQFSWDRCASIAADAIESCPALVSPQEGGEAFESILGRFDEYVAGLEIDEELMGSIQSCRNYILNEMVG